MADGGGGNGGLNRPKIGLALGGGVARGWAHIGALRALKRYGIEPDVVCGASVGAVVGGMMLAGKLDALEEWVLSLNRLRIVSYLDLRIRSGGLIGGERLINEMRRHIGDVRIEDLTTPFAAVATDLITGHEVWLQDGGLSESLRASFSLPGVFPPVERDGRMLIDGALVNPVPVSVCRALGAIGHRRQPVGRSDRQGAQAGIAGPDRRRLRSAESGGGGGAGDARLFPGGRFGATDIPPRK